MIPVADGSPPDQDSELEEPQEMSSAHSPAAAIAAAINANMVVVGCSGHGIVPPTEAANVCKPRSSKDRHPHSSGQQSHLDCTACASPLGGAATQPTSHLQWGRKSWCTVC